MKSTLRLMLTLAAGVATLPALAATATPDDVRAAHDAAATQIRAALDSAANEAKANAAKRAKAMGNDIYPGTPLANEFRAYPPSCAAWPLPNKASGPTQTARVRLYTRNSAGQVLNPETVTMTLWRIACSSSGSETPYNTDGGYNSMTLLRIDRDSANEGHTDYFPTYPSLRIQQGNTAYDDPESYVRSATEPNTYMSDFLFDTPVFSSTTFVLENYNFDADYQHFYSYAYKLQINPYTGSNGDIVEFNVPAYLPAQGTYPDAFAPLPLDGYSAAQWINTEFNEGLLVQMTEQPQSNGSTVRQLVFDLLTEDLNGDPLWLVGNAPFAVGQTSINVNVNYLGNGLEQLPYGKAKFEVADCNHLDVTFTPNANLPNPIPTISGVTTYERLFTPNGMTCE
ncbi:MAG: hypothetical protein ACTHK2_18655 [Dokdonella sp.]|uniref:hypothetical protein n=1 Tax=Dokdonella sp. TaxID=2291710 RepID=UPI003F7D035A